MSCSKCNVSLAGSECVEKDKKHFCINCYNSQFGKICTVCQTLIPIGTQYASYGEKYWHRLCFRCATCNESLTTYKIGDDGQHYCSTCYNEKYGPKCIVCQKAITISLYVETEGGLCHEDCFRCSSKTCGKKLDDGYIPKDNAFFCQDCYNEIISTQIFTDIFACPSFVLTELLRKEQINMKSIAQTHKTELKPTIESIVKELLIPKILNTNLSMLNIEQAQTVLHLFPTIVMNAAVHNGSIQLVAGDLIKQNVDVIVVCSTSEILLKNILEQAGLVVTEEYNRLSSSVDQQNSLIETGPGNLSCKAILFLPWMTSLNQDSKIVSTSISEFVSKSLHHILYHPKVYRTVAFPAIGCGLIQCPVTIAAQAMIDAAIAKLKETMLYFTVSFVIFPNQFNVHQGFANRLALIQSPSEPFGSVQYSFSKLTLTFTAKQETNLKKCLSDIESHINICTQMKCRENEENLDIWTQQLVFIFYKYCLDHDIWPMINFEQKKVILIGEKKSIDDADKYFLELTTQALKQTHLDIVSRNIVWKYQIDSSTSWESYSYKCNAEIEYAFTFKKLSLVNITNEQSETCIIDFNKKEEIFNSRIRNIQRQNLTSYSLPTNWQFQSINCCRFILSEHLEEYKNIKEKFDLTMLGNYTCIKSIERVQNQRWYKQYAAHRDAMNERLKEDTEKILFHGCNEDSANSIVEECFNRSYAGVNGTVYGQGVYFATNAKYSHSYTRLNQANEHCMFVVLVLVGKSIFGNSSMKVPPKGYDSTTDNNEIFVVYHDAQAYADYLIKYE